MKKSLLVLVSTALLDIPSFSGSAAAHTLTDAAGHPIKHKAHVKAKQRKAATAMNQTYAGWTITPPASLPEVQIQSLAVSATSVAQTAVGSNVTPGKPAVPGK